MTKITTLTINPLLDKRTSARYVIPDRKLRCGSPSVEHIPVPAVRIRSRISAGDNIVAGIIMDLERGKMLHHAVCV